MQKNYYNPKLRTLLSIRHFDKALEMHFEQLKALETQLSITQKNALSVIENNCSATDVGNWKSAQQACNDAVELIHKMVQKLHQKIANKDRTHLSEIWTTFLVLEKTLKQSFRATEKMGYALLPKSVHPHWQKDVCNFEAVILPLIIAQSEACKIELQLIETYTPKEIAEITQTVANHIPEDFTFEQADKYERDYLKAIAEMKKEVTKKKNTWVQFLNLLTGGTYQSASERMMMQRWVNGEKEDAL